MDAVRDITELRLEERAQKRDIGAIRRHRRAIAEAGKVVARITAQGWYPNPPPWLWGEWETAKGVQREGWKAIAKLTQRVRDRRAVLTEMYAERRRANEAGW